MRIFLIKSLLVIAGGSIQGFGMGLFLFPHTIPSGGAGGLAVLFHYLMHLDIGFSLWLVNFSMLVLAIKYLGNSSTVWTMLAITITSCSIYFFQRTIHFPLGNGWVDLFFGSIFLGIGVGLLLRQNVSNGGVGVIALIIAKMRNVMPGRPLFIINACIFILTASIIDWKIIIQALISQWISTKIVDLIYNFNFNASYTLGWRKK